MHADSALGRYLAALAPHETSPVARAGGDTTFDMALGHARVFIRESARELLLIELSEGGALTKIGVAPKD